MRKRYQDRTSTFSDYNSNTSPENNMYIDLSLMKNFRISVNYSVLFLDDTFQCKLSENEIYIIPDNIFVRELNDTTIKKKFSDLDKLYFEYDKNLFLLQFQMADYYFEISCFVYEENNYILRIMDNLYKHSSPDNYFIAQYLPINKHHHYGILELFTYDKLNKLEKDNMYYIVWGQNWDLDYTGENSIMVFKFKGISDEEDNESLLGTLYGVGEVFDADVIYLEDDIFVTGSGGDPVQLVKSFRPQFRPPSDLPYASTLSKL